MTAQSLCVTLMAVAAIVEVNSETDFVAADANFETFANDVMTTILDNRPSSIEQVGELAMPSGGSVEEARTQLITKLAKIFRLDVSKLLTAKGELFRPTCMANVSVCLLKYKVAMRVLRATSLCILRPAIRPA